LNECLIFSNHIFILEYHYRVR